MREVRGFMDQGRIGRKPGQITPHPTPKIAHLACPVRRVAGSAPPQRRRPVPGHGKKWGKRYELTNSPSRWSFPSVQASKRCVYADRSPSGSLMHAERLRMPRQGSVYGIATVSWVAVDQYLHGSCVLGSEAERQTSLFLGSGGLYMSRPGR
jgi:hypothetical protein